MRIVLPILLTASLYAATPAQVWSPSEMKSSAAQLPAQIDPKNPPGKTLGAYGSHSASLWKRAKSGQAELHKTKTDLIVIEDGSATLVTGGVIADAHPTEANEVRGASIRGGESKKVAQGDIIHIPAGTPHQFLLEAGQSVTYVAIKIAR